MSSPVLAGLDLVCSGHVWVRFGAVWVQFSPVWSCPGWCGYLCDVGELLAGEVDEGEVVEAAGDGGVVLDEGPAGRVLGEELVHGRVVAQQAAVRAERHTAQVTPGGGGTTEVSSTARG